MKHWVNGSSPRSDKVQKCRIARYLGSHVIEVLEGDQGVLEGLVLLGDLEELDVGEDLRALVALVAAAVILTLVDVEEGQSLCHSRVHLQCSACSSMD